MRANGLCSFDPIESDAFRTELKHGVPCDAFLSVTKQTHVRNELRVYNSFMDTKQTRHPDYNINYHLVFCPKYRLPVFEGDIGNRLAELIPQDVARMDVEELELALMPV